MALPGEGKVAERNVAAIRGRGCAGPGGVRWYEGIADRFDVNDI
jgi:hypothetical protein